jgi:hypothetical protein
MCCIGAVAPLNYKSCSKLKCYTNDRHANIIAVKEVGGTREGGKERARMRNRKNNDFCLKKTV